jgi:non-heme chloroperoxidase
VQALDTRGHGDSGWDPDGDYSLDALVADLVAVLEEIGRPAILVGASLGGMTSLIVTSDRPDLVCGLVLVDVVVKVEAQGVARIHSFMTAHHDGFETLAEVADTVAGYNPQRRRPTNLVGLRKIVRQERDGRWYWHWDPAFISHVEDPQRHVDQDRLAEKATSIRVPTLVVRGLMSDVVSESGVVHLLELIPGAEVINVAGAGHMVAGDENDTFGGVLDQFLDQME